MDRKAVEKWLKTPRSELHESVHPKTSINPKQISQRFTETVIVELLEGKKRKSSNKNIRDTQNKIDVIPHPKPCRPEGGRIILKMQKGKTYEKFRI